MHNEEIRRRWQNYIDDMFNYNLFGEKPYLFESSYCATCIHWYLLNEEGLHHVAITAPNDYERIMIGLEGNIIKPVKEEGEIIDSYQDHQFFGWCKRYPPIIKNNYSILRIRSIFSRLATHVPKLISEFGYPLMPHDECCGEWGKDLWVDKRLNEEESKKSRESAQPSGEPDC